MRKIKILILIFLLFVVGCSINKEESMDYESFLYLSTMYNDYEYSSELLASGVNGLAITEYGYFSPLSTAMGPDYDKIVKAYLDNGNYIVNENDLPIIIDAVYSKSKKIIDLLLNEGYDVNIRSTTDVYKNIPSNSSAIDVAAYSGSKDIYNLLKENGAIISNNTLKLTLISSEISPDMNDIQNDILKTLRKNKLNIEISPILQFAIEKNSDEVNKLIKTGNYLDSDISSLLKITFEVGNSSTLNELKNKGINYVEYNKNDILRDTAYGNGNLEIINTLYSDGIIKKNEFDEYRYAKYNFANFVFQPNFKVEQVTKFKIEKLGFSFSEEQKYILDQGINAGISLEGIKYLDKQLKYSNVKIKKSDALASSIDTEAKDTFDYLIQENYFVKGEEDSALSEAISIYGNRYYFNKLLEVGADININEEYSLISDIAETNDIEGFYYLKENGYDFKKFKNKNISILLKYGRHEMLQGLIDEGIEIKTYKFEDEKKSAIMNAVSYCNHGIFDVLLKNGKDVIDFQGSKTGKTALHAAAESIDPYFAKELVKNGADRSIKDKNGKTPLDLAKKNGNKEIIEILEK